MANSEVAFLAASVTSLASVMQFVHGNKKDSKQEIPPAVNALIKSSGEILESRKTPAHKAYTKKIVSDRLKDIQKTVKRTKATNLEHTVALVEYLEWLRVRKVGMDSDELVTSLTVYNIAQAYKELSSSQVADIRRQVVESIQDHLLKNLR